jgi:acyl-CoA synthetase (AMP-forming)/AMP-acid ligase II
MMSDSLPSTIPQLLARSLAARPGEDAIVTAGETLSYQALDQRTARIASALVGLGAGKGTRIALMMPDGATWLTMFLGAMRIGALVAPVSTLCTAPELAHILRHSDAQILIAVRNFLRHDYAERLETALPGLAAAKAGALRLAQAPYLRSIWLDDAAGLGWAGTHEALVRSGADDGDDLIRAMAVEVVPSDDAVIIYTSGSTSLPKAVLHPQRTVARHAQVLADQFLITAESRMMPLLPLFWIGGLVMALEVLQAGGTLVYPDGRSTEAVLDAMQRFKVNRINSWGPQLGKLREAATAVGIDVDEIVGLGPFRDAAGVLIPPGRASNMLGMTESVGPHSSEPLDVVLPENRAGASGRGIGGIERRVVDFETGEVLPPGRAGELQLRGGALMKGFYKVDPREVFTPDGFYPTHDIVRIDEEGYLYFEARRGDMLKTSGANVSRLEVEAALRSLPEVELPIVVGLADPEAGQLVVAAVVLRDGIVPSEDALREALRERLSSFKIPKRIIAITAEEVEWTPSNKIKLAEMAELIRARL